LFLIGRLYPFKVFFGDYEMIFKEYNFGKIFKNNQRKLSNTLLQAVH